MKVLWIPHAPWYTPQRARFFVEQLAKDHQVFVTDWQADFTRLPDFLSHRYLRNFFSWRYKEGGVPVEHVPRVAPALFSPWLRSFNTHLYQRTLERLIARERIDVVVGSFVVPPPENVPKVVDIFDDNVAYWLEYGKNKAYAEEIAANEEAWISSSAATVVVSSVLADKMSARYPGARIVYIPNGVDLGVYVPDRSNAREKLGLDPERPLVGNIGSLDRAPEAVRLLAVAAALKHIDPGARLVLAGRGSMLRGFLGEAAQRGLDNVHYAGFATGERLVGLFQSLDVGLCPYLVTTGSNAIVPMRLLHYSAVGSRVVSSPLEEVRRMGFDNVFLAKDDNDASFVHATLSALEARAEPAVPAQISHYDLSALSRRYAEILAQAVPARLRPARDAG